jgi:hypothetical protein
MNIGLLITECHKSVPFLDKLSINLFDGERWIGNSGYQVFAYKASRYEFDRGGWVSNRRGWVVDVVLKMCLVIDHLIWMPSKY